MFLARASVTIWEELEDCGATPSIVGWIVSPQNMCQSPTPGTCECDLTWN